MKQLYPLLPVLVALAMYGFLYWCRKGGGGAVGRAIRRSDHAAWRHAIDECQKDFNRAYRKAKIYQILYGSADYIELEHIIRRIIELRRQEPREDLQT